MVAAAAVVLLGFETLPQRPIAALTELCGGYPMPHEILRCLGGAGSPKTTDIPSTGVMVPVCHCELPKATCEKCGKGYTEVVLQGQAPKFLPRGGPSK